MGSFGISEGNIIGRGKKKKEPTDYMPSCDFQWTGSLDAHFCRQQARPEQGSMGCLHRVGTGSECPVDYLRELRRESNPNCGITRKKKRERETTFL